jgi:hypothetical protein
LADIYQLTKEEREACVEKRRLCNQDIHGISLRDQGPAHESKMKTCLVNISIPEWLALLNSKIFFFVEEHKASRFAETYGSYRNILLETDTSELLRTHAAGVTLCRINAGAFLYNPRPRGLHSFIPLQEYKYKNKRDTPAELTISDAIPTILNLSRIISLPA